MRRTDREITDFRTIIAIMERCQVCRLALQDTPYPYIVPMNFGMAVENGTVTLYFHSASVGTKLDLLRADPHAAFEMECDAELASVEADGNCTMTFKSVIGQGLVSFVEGEEKLRGLDLLVRHYHPDGFPWNRSYIPATTVFKLTVQSMTCKYRPDPRPTL